jgi:hypothetical protein
VGFGGMIRRKPPVPEIPSIFLDFSTIFSPNA